MSTEHPLKSLPYSPRISAQQRREALKEHLWPHTLAAEMGKDLPKARGVKKKGGKKFFFEFISKNSTEVDYTGNNKIYISFIVFLFDYA